MTRWLPIRRWLPAYRGEWLAGDLVAGVTTAAVVIPQAMAYATIAGLPVQFGLYVSFVPMLAYAFLGTSRALSVSTTSTLAILTATAIASVATTATEAATAAATLAVLVGCLLLVAGVFRLGFLADFISLPILTGFKIGTGLVIAASQLGKLLGISVNGDNFFQDVRSALQQLGEANGATVVLSLATIAVLLALRRFAPRVPGALVAVVGGILAVSAFDLVASGVAVIPPVPEGLPGFSLPDWGLVEQLLPSAAGVALMSFVESIAAGRAFARRADGPLDADQELVALGASNLSGGLLQALPSGGGLSQTAVNDASGARSQLAGAVTAMFALVTMLFLTALFADLAEATLGAIVLVAILGLLDSRTIRRIGSVRSRDGWLAVGTVIGVLFLGVLNGILIAVVLSLMVLIHGVNVLPIRVLGRDPISRDFEDQEKHSDLETFPGLLIVKPEGGLYFANARRCASRILTLVDADPAVRVVLIDASAVPDWDVTAGEVVVEDLFQDLAERDIDLWISALTERPLQMVRRSDAVEVLEAGLFRTVAEGVDRFLSSAK
ncbi:MAG TPA: SulP family inorganic anion transporter [Acidimicrobiia bacterium]|nr:SulP family inorganic anion transporter [Acidimicrobiia bacterium]